MVRKLSNKQIERTKNNTFLVSYDTNVIELTEQNIIDLACCYYHQKILERVNVDSINLISVATAIKFLNNSDNLEYNNRFTEYFQIRQPSIYQIIKNRITNELN